MGCVQKEKPKHSYSGERWRTNPTNKKYLAVDFKGRCAYCDDKDFYYGGKRSFHVEHFAPKEKFEKLKYVYENLLYSCPYCNEAKSDIWVSNSPDISVIGNEGFVNPCSDEYDVHLERLENGKISAKTELGKFMHKTLKLYLLRHELFYKLDEVEAKLKLLQSAIDNGKKNGKDMTSEEELCNELQKVFFTYYMDWQKLD